MKTFALAALASVAAALAENFTIDPLPELTTCVPANLTWHGGVPPYTVQIRGGSHPVPLYTIRTDETFYTWVVNVTAGKHTLLDARRALNWLRDLQASRWEVRTPPDTAIKPSSSRSIRGVSVLLKVYKTKPEEDFTYIWHLSQSSSEYDTFNYG
ncbi:hypothetical protein GLOTRDRAFT_95194 [Gloeophyllum trabeum ATCC 11539]|uniref:Uncharacterized protein n=1 Tax=Gloeophyllum trabeum (strain ATCC 11539 / FP-39264 / Madison 617) TaxID=670483 RepID=S7PZT5_GLOTA|nr:uncharacterized protein GLOTRDRAFT_95194 [Gloeophyllum trabeum ATCC 11539]EPQ53186.1 hypothetical protein GLOTRDRAFT_95194 [Gloeophyllum trabeum ATCC 11539]